MQTGELPGTDEFITRCERVVVLSDFMRRRVMAVHGIPSERIVVIPGATARQLIEVAADGVRALFVTAPC